MTIIKEQFIYYLYGLIPILFNINQGGKNLKPTEISETTTLTLKLPAIITVLVFLSGCLLSIGTLYRQVDENKAAINNKLSIEEYKKDRALDSKDNDISNLQQEQFRKDMQDNVEIIIHQLEEIRGKKIERKIHK